MVVPRVTSFALVFCALFATAAAGSELIAPAGTEDPPTESKLEFSLDTALPSLYLSYAAYCPHEDVEHANCTWCGFLGERFTLVGDFSTPDVLDEGNTYGFVGYADNLIYVVFRGSAGWINWVYNFKALKVKYPACEDCEVHRGFEQLYDLTRPFVKNLTAQAQSECPTCKRVVVTGHSLGAALSMLGALDLERELPLPVSLLNFGQPRVGNLAFADYAQALLSKNGMYRVVHGADPCPHVPPELGGFYHAGTEVWNKGSDKEYLICADDHGHNPKCSESMFPFWKPLDHALYLSYNILDPVGDKPACKDLKWPHSSRNSAASPTWKFVLP